MPHPRRRPNILLVGVIGVAVGILALTAFNRATQSAEANRRAADLDAQIVSVTPARELIVMYADATVIASAAKPEVLNQRSELYYISRAKFIYSVDMRSVARDAFAYDAARDVLTVRIPKIKVQAHPYGPRKRMADLALLAFEGGSGNELEQRASAGLESNAAKEAARPETVAAATKSAKFEIAKLYEDAFRAAGRQTRVIVVADGEPLPAAVAPATVPK